MLTNSDEEPLGFLLVDVTRLLRSRIDLALDQSGLGLTSGEARTLVNLGRFAPLHQHALAARMSIEPMTLVRYLDRLEHQGLVRRTVDPADRRAKLVQLTPKAKPLLDEVLALARRVRGKAMRGLSAAEVAALRVTLLAMRANLTESESQAA